MVKYCVVFEHYMVEKLGHENYSFHRKIKITDCWLIKEKLVENQIQNHRPQC